MQMLTNSEVKVLNNMHVKWSDFKSRRKNKDFENETGTGYLTILEREALLDKVFSIIIKDD